MDVPTVLGGIVLFAVLLTMVERGPRQVRDYEHEHELGAHRTVRLWACPRCDR